MKRFSLASGMAAVFFLAIGSAALSHPTELWASALFTFAVFLLCWASVVAITRRRAFWVGFAVFGWVYLILSLGLFGAKGTPLAPFPPAPPLVTKKLVDYLERKVVRESSIVDNAMLSTATPGLVSTSGFAFNPITPFGVTITGQLDPTHTYFHQIGHTILALLAAILGGFLAGLVARRDRNHSAGAKVLSQDH